MIRSVTVYGEVTFAATSADLAERAMDAVMDLLMDFEGLADQSVSVTLTAS
jgi:hypothetical protein